MVAMLCVVWGGVHVAAAGPAAESELAGRVRALVRQLDDDQLARRLAAEKQLIQLGPGVLDLLPEITRRTSAEVKQRLERIRTLLQRQAAQAATQASLVTLRGEMSLAEALSALEQQTGNRVLGFQNRGGTVKVLLDKTPYWEALDQILDQVGLTINPYGGQANALSLMSRPDEVRPRSGCACYNGIFRLEVVQVRAVRDFRNPQLSALHVTMEIGWEPRALPISLGVRTAQLQARDENGDLLQVDGGQRELEALVQSDIPVVEFVLPFQLPDRSVRRIVSLKGKLLAMIPGRTETFQFAHLEQLRDAQKRHAGVTVTFERLRKNVELFEARIRVRFDQAANALESHRGWVYNNEAYLVNAAGQRVLPATFETTRQQIDEVGVAYLFDLKDGPAGYTFVYKTPAAIIKTPVEFTFKDIDLP